MENQHHKGRVRKKTHLTAEPQMKQLVNEEEVSNKHSVFTLTLTINRGRGGLRKDNGGDNGVWVQVTERDIWDYPVLLLLIFTQLCSWLTILHLLLFLLLCDDYERGGRGADGWQGRGGSSKERETEQRWACVCNAHTHTETLCWNSNNLVNILCVACPLRSATHRRLTLTDILSSHLNVAPT